MTQRTQILFILAAKWTWLLCLFFVSMQVSTCPAGIKTRGSTYPEDDIYVEEGSDLVIYCSISEECLKNFTSRDIGWSVGRKDVKPYITVLNITTARLQIRNVSLSDRNSYSCVVYDSSKNRNIVCTNAVFVDNLRTVKANLTCLSREWKSMECQWKLSKPTSVNPTDWNLYFVMTLGNNVLPVTCEKSSRNSSKCSLKGINYHQFREEFAFFLIGHNTNDKVSHFFTFDHYSRVKPPKLEHINVETQGNGSDLSVTWRINHYFQSFPRNLSYALEYRSQWDDENKWTVIHFIKSINGSLEYMLRNLTPYTNYTIRLKCRPENATEDDVWSDYAEAIMQTLSQVPLSAPEVIQGSYEESPIPISTDTRTVIVFWKPLEESQKYGPNFYYQIQLTNLANGIIKEVTALKPFLFRFTDIDRATPYRVVIRSGNSKGLSVAYSVISIDGATAKRPRFRSMDMISVLNTSKADDPIYEIKLSPWISKDTSLRYVLYWCTKEGDSYNACAGPLQWRTFDPNSEPVQYVHKPQQKRQIFGVSVSTNESSSGIVFGDCVTAKISEIGKPKLDIKNVRTNSFDLNLRLPECQARHYFVVHYEVTVSDSDGSFHEVHNVSADYPSKVESVYPIDGLKPLTNYTVEAIARTRESMDIHEPAYLSVLTLETGPDYTYLGAIFGALIGALFLGLLIYCLYRAWVKWRDFVKINVPFNDEEYEIKKKKPEEDDDVFTINPPNTDIISMMKKEEIKRQSTRNRVRDSSGCSTDSAFSDRTTCTFGSISEPEACDFPMSPPPQENNNNGTISLFYNEEQNCVIVSPHRKMEHFPKFETRPTSYADIKHQNSNNANTNTNTKTKTSTITTNNINKNNKLLHWSHSEVEEVIPSGDEYSPMSDIVKSPNYAVLALNEDYEQNAEEQEEVEESIGGTEGYVKAGVLDISNDNLNVPSGSNSGYVVASHLEPSDYKDIHSNFPAIPISGYVVASVLEEPSDYKAVANDKHLSSNVPTVSGSGYVVASDLKPNYYNNDGYDIIHSNVPDKISGYIVASELEEPSDYKGSQRVANYEDLSNVPTVSSSGYVVVSDLKSKSEDEPLKVPTVISSSGYVVASNVVEPNGFKAFPSKTSDLTDVPTVSSSGYVVASNLKPKVQEVENMKVPTAISSSGYVVTGALDINETATSNVPDISSAGYVLEPDNFKVPDSSSGGPFANSSTGYVMVSLPDSNTPVSGYVVASSLDQPKITEKCESNDGYASEDLVHRKLGHKKALNCVPMVSHLSGSRDSGVNVESPSGSVSGYATISEIVD